jgi:hypothetical protein
MENGRWKKKRFYHEGIEGREGRLTTKNARGAKKKRRGLTTKEHGRTRNGKKRG